MKEVMTLCIVHQHPRVLLGMKKVRLGAGRWNGFGGRIEKGESIEDAARREIREEAGIEVKNLEKLGVIEFTYESGPGLLEVHFFKANDFSGEPKESDEMRPQWFLIDEIPFMNMWPGDVYWMPYFLSGRKFKGKFLFDKPSDASYTSKIIAKELSEAEKF